MDEFVGNALVILSYLFNGRVQIRISWRVGGVVDGDSGMLY